MSQDDPIARLVAWAERERPAALGLAPADLFCAELAAAVAVRAHDATLQRIAERGAAAGLAPSFVVSVLLHLAGYVGVPAVERAASVLADRWRGVAETLLRIPPSFDARVETGTLLYRQFDPRRPEAQAARLAPLGDGYYARAMEISGVVLGSGELALREREIVAIAALAAMGGCEAPLRFHVGVGLRNGVDVPNLAGCLIVVQVLAGVPRANTAALIAAEVVAAPGYNR